MSSLKLLKNVKATNQKKYISENRSYIALDYIVEMYKINAADDEVIVLKLVPPHFNVNQHLL